jgi:hypothetical protein
MKKIEFSLDHRAVELFFSPIRNKADIIILLMNSIKYMIVYYETSQSNTYGNMSLIVSDMSRLTFFSGTKYFSICFPFVVNVTDGSLIEFHTNCGTIIDNKLTSEVLSIVNDGRGFDSQDVFDFLESIDQVESPSDGLWNTFMNLMLFEDGYVRFDFDEERADPIFHPLNHLDIFYGSKSTFKLGLYETLDRHIFIDMFDASSACHYIQKRTL